jgi:hypothetical protein
MALAVPLVGQSMTVTTSGGMLRVRAPEFAFIEGGVLERLRDGQSLRLDFELIVLAGRGNTTIAEVRQSFNVSFDLWEERFAVTRIGTPPRSISHLQARDAEAWCLEHLTVPRVELGRLAPDAPFWIRLAYQAPNPSSVSDSAGADTFTLRRLIDVLSRRDRARAAGRTVEAGPFRLSD